MNIRAYFPLNRRIFPGDTGALIVTIVVDTLCASGVFKIAV